MSHSMTRRASFRCEQGSRGCRLSIARAASFSTSDQPLVLRLVADRSSVRIHRGFRGMQPTGTKCAKTTPNALHNVSYPFLARQLHSSIPARRHNFHRDCLVFVTSQASPNCLGEGMISPSHVASASYALAPHRTLSSSALVFDSSRQAVVRPHS